MITIPYTYFGNKITVVDAKNGKYVWRKISTKSTVIDVDESFKINTATCNAQHYDYTQQNRYNSNSNSLLYRSDTEPRRFVLRTNNERTFISIF